MAGPPESPHGRLRGEASFKLMKKVIVILITTLTFHGCSSASSRKETGDRQSIKEGHFSEADTNKFPITKLRVEELRFIHTFVNPKGEILGTLYGKEKADSTYSDFLIVKEINGKFTPIYVIDKSTFQNTNGKENYPMNGEGFYGYRVLVTVKDDMGIEPLFKVKGKILKGDPVTIKWDKTEKVFKVLLTP